MAKSTIVGAEYRKVWKQVNKHFDAGQLFWKNTVTQMRLLGDSLIKAKELTEHGDWEDALQEYCPQISDKWARQAMRIAREWDRIEQIADHEDTIEGVLGKLKKPKEPKQESKTEVTSDLKAHFLPKLTDETQKTAEKPDDPLPADAEPQAGFQGWNDDEPGDVIDAQPVDPVERIKELWAEFGYDERFEIVQFIDHEWSEWQREPANGKPYSEAFELFWLRFPRGRKRAKGNAWKAWLKAIDSVDASEIIEAATEFADSPLGQSEYVPMPSSWLNGCGWEDDREAWQAGKKSEKEAFLARFK